MLSREENDGLGTYLKWYTHAFYDRLLFLGLTVAEKEHLFRTCHSEEYERQIINDIKQDQKNHQIPRSLSIAELRKEFVRLLHDFIVLSPDKDIEVFFDTRAQEAAAEHKLIPLFSGMLDFSDRAKDFLTGQRLSPTAIERSATEWEKIRSNLHQYQHLNNIQRERNFLIWLALIFAIYFVIQLFSRRENLLTSGALTLLTFVGSEWDFAPAMLKPDLHTPTNAFTKQMKKFIAEQREKLGKEQRYIEAGLSVIPEPRPVTAPFPELETRSKKIDRTSRANAAKKMVVDEKKQAPEVNSDLDDGAGSIYLRMNRRGWYFRYNRTEIEAKSLVQKYAPDRVMNKIENALSNRGIYKVNAKESGVTEVSRQEDIPSRYKVRIRHNHRLWVNTRAAGTIRPRESRDLKDLEKTLEQRRAFELAHPEIETVLTPVGEGLHKKIKRG